MDPQLITLGGILASMAGAWAVTRYQTSDHKVSIDKLEAAKASLTADVAKQATEIAVLKAQASGADRRMTESLTAIRDTIAQSEQRVIAHFDSAVQALRSGGSETRRAGDHGNDRS